MRIKLNGWQRVGVVLNVIYLIIIIIAWNMWPTQKQIESSWVYSALDAIRKPESPSAYELMEGRFKDISDRELIKRINLEYNAKKVREIMPNIFDKIEAESKPRDVFDEAEAEMAVEVARKAGYSDNEIADSLAKENNFDIQGARKAGYSDNEIINYFSRKNMKQVTDPFLISQLEGELITPGEKLARQCQEKLEKVNLRYQKEIETLGINRLKIVGIAFMAWIIPSGIVYLLGFSIGCICRGFKENKTSTKKLNIEETKKNKKQRAIIIGGIVAITIMFLFPPYALYYGGSKFQKGYHVNYFLKPSKENIAIDSGTLSIQYVTVIIIGSLLWILARDTKLKDNLKGDQEKTK